MAAYVGPAAWPVSQPWAGGDPTRAADAGTWILGEVRHAVAVDQEGSLFFGQTEMSHLCSMLSSPQAAILVHPSRAYPFWNVYHCRCIPKTRQSRLLCSTQHSDKIK